MSDARRRPPLADPTSERTADQSTQTSGGLQGAGEETSSSTGSDPTRDHDTEDVLNRSSEDRYETPRRYDADHRATAAPDAEPASNRDI